MRAARHGRHGTHRRHLFSTTVHWAQRSFAAPCTERVAGRRGAMFEMFLLEVSAFSDASGPVQCEQYNVWTL